MGALNAGAGFPLSCSTRYTLRRVLGTGSYGTVFLAHDGDLDREVAVKVLKIEAGPDDARWARLVREARIGVKLRHPGIVTLLDCQLEEDPPWLVYEYVEGGPISESLEAGGLPWLDVLDGVMQVIPALAEAHSQGVIHRDLKPDNILLTPDGTLKLIDFGLARLVEQNQTLTISGRIAGTPAYLAPEVIAGHPATPASDQYSLGIVLYELLTGRPPYEGRTVVELLEQHMKAPVPDVCAAEPTVPKALGGIVRRMLAKDPQNRYPDLVQVLPLLQSILDGELTGPRATTAMRARARPAAGATRVTAPATPSPRRARGPLVALALLGGVAGFLLIPRGPAPPAAPTPVREPEATPGPATSPRRAASPRPRLDADLLALLERTRQRSRSRLFDSMKFISAADTGATLMSYQQCWSDLDHLEELEHELGEQSVGRGSPHADLRRSGVLLATRFLIETEIFQQAAAYRSITASDELSIGQRAPVSEGAALARLAQCLIAFKQLLALPWAIEEIDEVLALVTAIRRVAARARDNDWLLTKQPERDQVAASFESHLRGRDDVESPAPWRRLAACAWRIGYQQLDALDAGALREDTTRFFAAALADRHVQGEPAAAALRKFRLALE